MKKRKFKILKVDTKTVEDGGLMVTFHTKVGPFMYLLTNFKVLKSFRDLNPKIVSKDAYDIDLIGCVGKFLFVPERKGGN